MGQQHQEQNDWKRNFNIAYVVMLWHQRALLVPFRKHWGTQALGFPSLLAFILMILWATATRDNLMVLYIGFWLLCQLIRRIQAARMSKYIHSQSAGRPLVFGSMGSAARLVIEPLFMGIIGWWLFQFYEDNGWRPTGLPYFFLTGLVSLPFVELTNQMIWNRRLQSMADSRKEQEMLMGDYKNRFGN
ncbi:MAG: hypothetical protein ACYC3I_08005 [Gemmataceae bacterium]